MSHDALCSGYVAGGKIGMGVRRMTDTKPSFWEYPKVTVIQAVKGKCATWLLVRDDQGNEQRVLARRLSGEESTRRWHPEEAQAIWGERSSRKETHHAHH